MGASNRDMHKGGTILVFGMNILNLKGYHGKGTKRKETNSLIYVQTMNFLEKALSKISPGFLNVHTTGRTISFCNNVFGYFVFI